MKRKLSETALIDLAKQIMNFTGSDDELIQLMERFNENVPHPCGASLIFFQCRGEERQPNYNPSPEEVVEKALNYQPLPTSLLTEPEKKIILECLKAASEGPFFPDAEFQTLFGLTRVEITKTVELWVDIDIFVDDGHIPGLINDVMANLVGYPHKQDNVWSDWISVSKEELYPLLDKWFHIIEWKHKQIRIPGRHLRLAKIKSKK